MRLATGFSFLTDQDIRPVRLPPLHQRITSRWEAPLRLWSTSMMTGWFNLWQLRSVLSREMRLNLCSARGVKQIL